ncbi:hypothetical protein Ancab_021943 [Ancistrocladus abbreviatus]
MTKNLDIPLGSFYFTLFPSPLMPPLAVGVCSYSEVCVSVILLSTVIFHSMVVIWVLVLCLLELALLADVVRISRTVTVFRMWVWSVSMFWHWQNMRAHLNIRLADPTKLNGVLWAYGLVVGQLVPFTGYMLQLL